LSERRTKDKLRAFPISVGIVPLNLRTQTETLCKHKDKKFYALHVEQKHTYMFSNR
jgi:hypothetical protein